MNITKTDGEDDKLRMLQASVDSNPDDPSLHFNLGIFLWENGDDDDDSSKEKSAEHFVISAKLNPLNGATFRYLGHYYYATDQSLHSSQRAIKCYQRAISLNPDDFESGEALCNLLDNQGKEILEASFCKEASDKSPRAFWAFRRLGFLQVHQNKWSQAVQSLQHAIRGYPSSADLWEALGLAYQRLGMFTAAIKSYGRAIELENSRVFALVESGNILLMLGSCGKGVDQFRKALEISPQNVSAYYGLASGLLGLSKECINLGAFRWAASLLEEASEVAKVGTCLAGNISCLWKLHGDILLTYAKCSPWAEDGWSLEFDKQAFLLSIVSYKKARCLAAMSSSRSYQRALHLAPWQPNIYTDIAITSDLICSLQESFKYDLNAWQLAEKMCLGGLLLEGDNSEFWVALGCLSGHKALKQHALIRGLHLDVSLAVAWAYLGKLYRIEGEKQLAQQAFDCARSIDPLLALPWAGMSADSNARETTLQEAYESCLRAVQILPLAEFQIGLAKLALLSGHLSSSQVYGAIQQAVQRAPHYPESHNLNGLVCEARLDYQSAASAYRLARYAISTSADPVPKSYFRDVSINLARSLSMAGNALDAVRECEDLKKEGLLDAEGLHIYALSLWQLGQKDLALSVARNLGAIISSMEQTSAAASIIFICRLLYYISGPESAITSILKMPKDVFQSPKVSFIVSSIHSLDKTNRLGSVVSSSCDSLTSNEEIIGMHFLTSLSKLVKSGSKHGLNFQSGVDHLRKALHMYPSSTLIRNLLGYLLLSSKECEETHFANRFSVIDPSDCRNNEGLRSASEIHGAGAVACYVNSNSNSRFSFPTCRYQCRNGPGAIQQLQKWLHQEPWNHTARYLLILNVLQRAREERFPRHLCTILERLLLPALSNQFNSKPDMSYQYQKFQLLLCASETSLQSGDHISSINHAKNASALVLPDGYLFFAHLQLCRAYAIEDNSVKLREEYIRCLDLKTEYPIGWICLKLLESQFKLETDPNSLDLSFEEFLQNSNRSSNMWMAVFTLVRGLNSLLNQDFLHAEEFLGQACLLANAESCLFLCHGAVCLELARQQYGSQLLLLAAKSLTKGRENSTSPLPLVSALLAQAEGSLGSKAKWEKNLHLEWLSWPPEMRPAELLFQMHLLSRQPKIESDTSFSLESCQSPLRWVLQAIHLNPSCLRYWKVLQKLTSEYAQSSCMQSGPGWE